MPCFNKVFVISLWCTSLVMGNQELAITKHIHYVSMACFSCKVPQPKIFYPQDLMTQSEWKKYEDKKHRIIPPATVLYTCNSSGYCGSLDETCLNISEEYVNLTFAIKPDPNLNQKRKTFEYIEIQHINHTRCACQKKVDINIKK